MGMVDVEQIISAYALKGGVHQLILQLIAHQTAQLEHVQLVGLGATYQQRTIKHIRLKSVLDEVCATETLDHANAALASKAMPANDPNAPTTALDTADV